MIQNSPLSNEGKEQSSNAWYHKNRWFVCEKCAFVFQTHSVFSKNTRKVYCPNCGENDNVNAYKSLRTASQRTPILWKDHEEKELKRLYDEGLMPHQIAIHLGRSTGSVREKLRRLGLWKRRVIG